jgi:hypothetical protein
MWHLNATHKRIYRHRQRLSIEPLEDRRLLSICNVVRLGDFGAGGVMGNFARGDLRFCVNHAINNPGPDAINLNVTGTILLTSKLPQLASDTTITGPGADLLAINGQADKHLYAGPLFDIPAGVTVHISGLTLTNGQGYSEPGGIYNKGTLMLKESTVSNSRQIDGCSCGGGIRNNGNMTISGSTISGNSVAFTESQERGGGIFNGGVMNILNSTVSGNNVLDGNGAGIYNAGSLDIRFSTITQNGGGFGWSNVGGILNQGGSQKLKLYSTIVAGNTSDSDTGDDNLEGGYTGSSNLIGGDPMLGPLQYNGGHTQTHAVLPGSPALDAGDNTNAPQYDQRGPGFPRIVNGTVDIGAFEVQSTGAPPMGGHPTRPQIMARVLLATVRFDVLGETDISVDSIDTEAYPL